MTKELYVRIAKVVEYVVEVDDDFVVNEEEDMTEFFADVEVNESPVSEDWESLEIEDEDGNNFQF